MVAFRENHVTATDRESIDAGGRVRGHARGTKRAPGNAPSFAANGAVHRRNAGAESAGDFAVESPGLFELSDVRPMQNAGGVPELSGQHGISSDHGQSNMPLLQFQNDRAETLWRR